MAALQLLQFADSALPIGSLSHSFGLETLVFDGDIEYSVDRCPTALGDYLEGCLSESLMMDAVFCREAHARGLQRLSIHDVNQQMSALRLARESREASLTLGRRFAALAASLQPEPALLSLATLEELHHAVAFGYTLGTLGIDADLSVGAFVHQCVLNTISSAQRLLPLGQTQANRIAWHLKQAILETAARTRMVSFSEVCSFGHLPETASMRHPCLPTRLFIS